MLKVFKPTLPGIACEDDWDDCGTPFWQKAILALLQGAAPILVGYAIARLDPSAVDQESQDEE